MRKRIIEKLLRKHSVGGNSTSIDQVAAWFPSHQRSIVQETVEELLHDPESPVEEASSTAVTNIRLRNVEDAVEYLQSRNGEVPWGFRNHTSDKSNENTVTSSNNSKNELHSRISDLEDELQMMDEAAEDWRSEARRRQRLSVLFGIVGFALGIITSGLFGPVVGGFVI